MYTDRVYINVNEYGPYEERPTYLPREVGEEIQKEVYSGIIPLEETGGMYLSTRIRVMRRNKRRYYV